MNTTPYFKMALLALGLLVLAFWSIMQNAMAGEVVYAPVVKPDGDVTVQVGVHRYARPDNAMILYCVPEGDVTLTCVVYITTPKGNGIIMVSGVKAERAQS